MFELPYTAYLLSLSLSGSPSLFFYLSLSLLLSLLWLSLSFSPSLSLSQSVFLSLCLTFRISLSLSLSLSLSSSFFLGCHALTLPPPLSPCFLALAGHDQSHFYSSKSYVLSWALLRRYELHATAAEGIRQTGFPGKSQNHYTMKAFLYYHFIW